MSSKDSYIEIDSRSSRLVLPSQQIQKNKKKIKSKKRQEKNAKHIKWTLIIILVVLLYLFYDKIILYLLGILQKNPTIYSYYLTIENEISNNTLKGLFFVSVLGSLFFLVLPSEALFIYYLNATSYNPLIIFLLTVTGCMVGLSFNYFFGRILGDRIIRFLFKKNYEKYKEKIDKYGGKVLLVGNIFPGPIEVLAVFYGGFKFSYARFVYLSLVGRAIKYMLLFLAFTFFWHDIMLYYNGFIDNFLILKGLYL